MVDIVSVTGIEHAVVVNVVVVNADVRLVASIAVVDVVSVTGVEDVVVINGVVVDDVV